MKRRAGLALVLGLAAAVAASTPIAGGQSGNVRVTCKTRAIDVYFWPHGHPYVKPYKFPAQKAPSLTVYRRGSFASRAFFFFLSARGFNYANTCDLATNPLPTMVTFMAVVSLRVKYNRVNSLCPLSARRRGWGRKDTHVGPVLPERAL